MYWVALGMLVAAAAFDLRRREIPDTIPACLLLAAVGAKLLGVHPVPWFEIALGAGVAFAASAALFHLGGLGGGDVKTLTALGAALGWKAFLPFIALTCIFGGLVAIVALRRKEEDPEIAYAPVMLAGLLALFPLVWVGS